MALRILKKNEKKTDPQTLPEGGDRFLWTTVPTPEAPVKKTEDYARILRGLTND